MISIDKIELPISILEETLRIFRKFGKINLEAFALWIGEEFDTTFKIKEVWSPSQENTMTSYFISEIEVHRINVELNKLQYSAIAQLHTHPENAFHSLIDDEHPILMLPGSFSIVIPNFGNISSCTTEKWAVYRLIDRNWKLLTNKMVRKTFKIKKTTT